MSIISSHTSHTLPISFDSYASPKRIKLISLQNSGSDNFSLQFGNQCDSKAVEVNSTEDIQNQLNILKSEISRRSKRLSAAKSSAEEADIIIQGILPPKGVNKLRTWPLIKGLWPLPGLYIPAEAYALTEDNPHNFFANGDIIPATYYMTDLDKKLCQAAAEYINETPTLQKKEIVDIGSGGDGFTKGKIFLNHDHKTPVTYIPIDLDDGMLNEASEKFLQDDRFNHVKVATLEGKFEDTLPKLPHNKDRLYLFLGGTIGNFTTKQLQDFTQQLNSSSREGSLLLVSYFRAPEDAQGIEDRRNAYADTQTENILRWFMEHTVKDLLEKPPKGAIGFEPEDPEKWQYRVDYDPEKRIVHRRLVCLDDQTMYFKNPKGAKRDFKPGDIIGLGFTKQFSPDDIKVIFSDFQHVADWSDDDHKVGLMLLQKKLTLDDIPRQNGRYGIRKVFDA